MKGIKMINFSSHVEKNGLIKVRGSIESDEGNGEKRIIGFIDATVFPLEHIQFYSEVESLFRDHSEDAESIFEIAFDRTPYFSENVGIGKTFGFCSSYFLADKVKAHEFVDRLILIQDMGVTDKHFQDLGIELVAINKLCATFSSQNDRCVVALLSDSPSHSECWKRAGFSIEDEIFAFRRVDIDVTGPKKENVFHDNHKQ